MIQQINSIKRKIDLYWKEARVNAVSQVPRTIYMLDSIVNGNTPINESDMELINLLTPTLDQILERMLK